jgi:putative ABC transport system permease protein
MWLRRLAFLARRSRADRELDEELQFHLDQRTRMLEDEGLAPDDARLHARRTFGSTLRVRERAADVWAIRWLDVVTQDIRYALRGLRRSPTFALAVVGTLAIGIGATSSIYALVDRVLLRPLPYRDPDRLVLVFAAKPDAGQPQLPLSYPNFRDLRDRARSFSGLAGWTLANINLVGTSEPEQLQYALVTANLFDVLGVRPVVGRLFRASEDRPGTAPVVVMGHGLWQRRFGGDPAIVGRRIQLEDRAHEVVGVLPQEFHFASFPSETELWLPFGNDRAEWRPYARGASSMGVIGRLVPDTTTARAQAELSSIAGALAREDPFFNRGRLMRAVPLAEQASASVRAALLILTASVNLLLLVACVNVVNLLLARSAARRHELAIRAALGAGRLRLSVQLFVEHVVLALIGGGVALLVAEASARLLGHLPYNAPDLFTPYVVPLDALGIDVRVALFTLIVTIVAGLAVGLGPAIRASRPSAGQTLGAGVRATAEKGAIRLRGLLVSAEVALAVVLLVAMGATLAGLVRLERTPPGFDPSGVLTAHVTLPQSKYAQASRVSGFYDAVLARLRAAPEVSHATAAESVPFTGAAASTAFYVEGREPPPPDRRTHVHYRSVADGYFEGLGIRLIDGRTFTERDDERAPRVAIVNETLARQVFAGERVLGRRLALDFETMRFYRDRPPDRDIPAGMREIVGVVADVRHDGLGAPALPEMYVPASQRAVREMTLVVRGRGDPLALVSTVRAAVAAVDPDQPLTDVAPMIARITASLARPRFNTGLLVSFGLVALALSAVGIYGVTAYAVTQRTRDLGVHVALGATPRDVLALVLSRSLLLVLAGLAPGLVSGLAVGRLLSGLVYDVGSVSLITLAAVSVLVLLVAAAATLIPAHRALRVDPVTALRAE